MTRILRTRYLPAFIAVVIATAFALVACGGEEDPTVAPPATTPAAPAATTPDVPTCHCRTAPEPPATAAPAPELTATRPGDSGCHDRAATHQHP